MIQPLSLQTIRQLVLVGPVCLLGSLTMPMQSNSIGVRVCLRSAHASWIQGRNKQQTTELLIKLFLIHTSNHNAHTICVAHTESG